MKKSLYILFLISLLSSCSSVKDQKFSDQVTPELVETFDLEGDQFSKFKVEEIEESSAITTEVIKSKQEPISKEIKKPTAKKKTKKKTKKKAKKAPVKKEEKRFSEKVAQKEDVLAKPVKKKSKYPEDYPEKLIEYSQKYKYVWDNVEPYFFPNESFVLKASYLGITVGHAKLETKPVVSVAGKRAFHFKGSLKSASYYSYIYEVEDWVESYVDADTFLPIKYTLVQRESGQDVDDLQLFDFEKLKTFFWYKRLKKGKIKKKELNTYVPEYFQDSFSALYFVRGLDLSVGSKYEFPILTRAKLWLMKMEVEKIEEIKIMGEWTKAYRIKAETRFPGVLKKKGDIIFWFSTDEYRKILKFQANVKIGAIEGELVKYNKGDAKVTK